MVRGIDGGHLQWSTGLPVLRMSSSGRVPALAAGSVRSGPVLLPAESSPNREVPAARGVELRWRWSKSSVNKLVARLVGLRQSLAKILER